jgi:excisionase family DNA binding protein
MSLFDESALREIIRDEIRTVMRQELGKKPAGVGDYVSVAEAAQIAAVSPQAIRTWIRAGKLKQFNAGRVIRVRRTELEALMASPAIAPESTGRQLTPEDEAHRFVARRISGQG